MTQPSDKPDKPSPPAEKRDPWDILYRPIHPQQTISRHLRTKLLAGLLWAIPLFITVLFVRFIYDLLTKFTQGPAEWLVKKFFWVEQTSAIETLRDYVVQPTLAIIIALLIVYVLGLLGGFGLGRRLLAAGEDFIANLPLIKGIYGTTKQVISVFRQGGGGQSFQRVVLVEFPRVGTWTVAFVTKTITDAATGDKYVCVFIPMTPNPTSGFFQMFPTNSVRDTDWTVDQGIKIVLSGGLLAPDELHFDRRTGGEIAETP